MATMGTPLLMLPGRRRFHCSRRLVIVLTLLLSSRPRTTEAFLLGFFFNRFLSNLYLNAACQAGVRNMGNFNLCTCDVEVERGLRRGDVTCSIGLSKCLVEPNLFCIQDDFKGKVTFGTLPFFRFASRIEGCFEFDSGPPPETNEFGAFRNLCLTIDPSFTNRINACEVTIGGQRCSQCSVCDSGGGITFSCANVDVGDTFPAFVAGPEVSKCMRLNLEPA